MLFFVCFFLVVLLCVCLCVCFFSWGGIHSLFIYLFLLFGDWDPCVFVEIIYPSSTF